MKDIFSLKLANEIHFSLILASERHFSLKFINWKSDCDNEEKTTQTREPDTETPSNYPDDSTRHATLISWAGFSASIGGVGILVVIAFLYKRYAYRNNLHFDDPFDGKIRREQLWRWAKCGRLFSFGLFCLACKRNWSTKFYAGAVTQCLHGPPSLSFLSRHYSVSSLSFVFVHN